MAFDQKTRNLLQRTVTACRRILDREFTAQFQELYGIQPSGVLSPLAALDHLGDEELQVARLLRERLNHLEGGVADNAATLTQVKPEHVARVIREQAFTVLNRLAALRLCEERGLVLECVRKGFDSEGFQLFLNSAGNALGERHEAYCIYLHCLFDELAIDLGVLFDRFSPLGLLFPRKDALADVLRELNGSGKAAEREEITSEQFAEIWKADETIGWVYQYYNDEAERKKMREESSAPRNSRELAVRNQFFTPRYVVEFLTDNTLGRIWYEMTQGQTRLREQCRYLVRRPNEIFLKPGEQPPSAIPKGLNPSAQGCEGRATLGERAGENSTPTGLQQASKPARHNPVGVEKKSYVDTQGSLADSATLGLMTESLQDSTAPTQEEQLKQPVQIPHRPLKDPRTILMLDPACGSMHFGLYAFDLFEVIYTEAWDNHPELLQDLRAQLSSPSPPAAGGEGRGEVGRLSTINSQPSTPEEARRAFLRLVPRLIIEHNIHGIDIDPRCAQIAGLSLWLRAQRAWQDMGLPPAQRPRIKRSNIVCAEPMPGEKELLKEFVEREFPPQQRGVYQALLETIFDRMQLAGEAGSLLKIEEEIRSAITQARQLWEERRQEFFDPAELTNLSRRPGTQRELPALNDRLSTLNLSDDAFWEQLEESIYTALRDYAEQAENGGGFQRRLFAEDAARGFSFIHICRQRYDVALMNPPFGDASLPSRPYIEDTYGDTKGDVYKAFVECFHARLVPAGYLGIISSRTGFFLGQSEDWRTRVVLRLFRPIALADLGSGVLDAMVEVAAYVLRSLSAPEARDLTHSIVPVLGKVGRDSQDRFSLPKWQAARGGLKRHQAVAELEHLEAHGFVQRSAGDTVRYTPLWHLVKKVTALPEPVFPPFVCVRVLADEDKGAAILRSIKANADPNTFICNPSEFLGVAGTPFSYWVSPSIRRLFLTLSPFESDSRIVRQGLATADDFRFIRAVWEVEATAKGSRWIPLVKGGKFHRFMPTRLSR